MTKEQEKTLITHFEEKLQEQFHRGMLIGTKALAGVVLEKATLYKSAEERIADIIDFCNVSLGLPDKK